MTIASRKITKAKIALEDIFHNGNLRKYGMTPTEAHMAWDVLVGILTNGISTTISETVRNFYDKYEFIIKEQDIGWEISV